MAEPGGPGPGRRGLRHPRDEHQRRKDQQETGRDEQDRALPSDHAQEQRRKRRGHEHAGRGGGGAKAKHEAALLRGDDFAQRDDHHRERAGAGSDPDDHARGDKDGGVDHGAAQEEPKRRHHRAKPEHAGGAMAVGDHAGEGLGQAPAQGLDCHRQRKHLASPSKLLRHRAQEYAEGGGKAEADEGDETARNDSGRDFGACLHGAGFPNTGDPHQVTRKTRPWIRGSYRRRRPVVLDRNSGGRLATQRMNLASRGWARRASGVA